MCGIAGYVRVNRAETSPHGLLRMLRAVRHRGPDDEGLAFILTSRGQARSMVTDQSAPGVADCEPLGFQAELPHDIALGHRRFSIIDLSAAAHQPFWSADGRVCVAFNGEIYNYLELKEELERAGRRFRTSSDTEVLVAAYQQWGAGCFERLNGFWAVSLYDADRRQVLLARDRIGKAPLYVTRQSTGLYWCSEIGGLREALGDHAFAINEQAVDDFVRCSWRDLFGQTFFAGITSFPAASHAWIQPDGRFEPVEYWRLPAQRMSQRDISVDDAAAGLREILADAVRIRLRADVPVGLDLSGGLDSSTIVALAVAARPSSRLRVFTVSYPGSTYDELPFARQVIEQYRDRLMPTTLNADDDGIVTELDPFVRRMQEPFHDPQVINLGEIWCRMRADGMRVSLNGAAGDELLAGYGGEYFGPYLRSLASRGRFLRWADNWIRYSERMPPASARECARRVYRLLPPPLRFRHRRLGRSSSAPDPYRPGAGFERRHGPSNDIEQRLKDYMTHWRMNYWCRIGNQNSMGVPLEFRCPFLDYRVVEFAFRLPLDYLIRHGWLKWILRKAMGGLLPDSILWRRQKMGFRYPLHEKLPLIRDDVLHMIGDVDCPYIDTKGLARSFDDLLSRDSTYLWRLLSVALWWKRCILNEPLAPFRAGRLQPAAVPVAAGSA